MTAQVKNDLHTAGGINGRPQEENDMTSLLERLPGFIAAPYGQYPRTRSARFAAARAAGWTVTTPNGEVEHDPRHRSDNRPWVGTGGSRAGSSDLVMVPSLEALQRGWVGIGPGASHHLAVTHAFAPCGTRLRACYTAPPLIHRGRNTGGTDEYDGGMCRVCYESEVLGMARLTDDERATLPYAAANLDELQAIVDHFGTSGAIPMYRNKIPERCFRPAGVTLIARS